MSTPEPPATSGITYTPVNQRIAYLCDGCGQSFDLIRFEIDKGEPDHMGRRLVSIRTTVREIVEHICEPKTEGHRQ